MTRSSASRAFHAEIGECSLGVRTIFALLANGTSTAHRAAMPPATQALFAHSREAIAKPFVAEPLMSDGVPDPVEDAPTARIVPFANRHAAGRLLGQALSHHAATETVVLGLAHGGMVVADAIAKALDLPRDVWVVRRLSPLDDRRVSLGVLSEGAALVLDRTQVAASRMTSNQIRTLVMDAAQRLAADARTYRGGRACVDVKGKTVILVDDGLQAGGRFSAALDGVKRRGAKHVVIAAPVGTQAAVLGLRKEADEVVCLAAPARVRRIASWYQDYRQVSDGALMKILSSSPT